MLAGAILNRHNKCMTEKYNFPSRQQTPPKGYRMAVCEMQGPKGPMQVEAMIPDEQQYPEEAVRLSRKATRNSGYKIHGWNDPLGIVLKTRETTQSRQGSYGIVHTAIRELHDAERTPKESLVEIHFTNMTYTGEHIGGEPIYPVEYVIYKPTTDELRRYYINTYSHSLEENDLQEAMSLADMTGESIATDRERMIFYAGLKFAAGEDII